MELSKTVRNALNDKIPWTVLVQTYKYTVSAERLHFSKLHLQYSTVHVCVHVFKQNVYVHCCMLMLWLHLFFSHGDGDWEKRKTFPSSYITCLFFSFLPFFVHQLPLCFIPPLLRTPHASFFHSSPSSYTTCIFFSFLPCSVHHMHLFFIPPPSYSLSLFLLLSPPSVSSLLSSISHDTRTFVSCLPSCPPCDRHPLRPSISYYIE